MTKKLKIKLLPNGEVIVKTEGVKGKKCLDYFTLLEKILDGRMTKQELSSEYYESENEFENSHQVQNIYDNYQ